MGAVVMPAEIWGSLLTFATVLTTGLFGYLTAKGRQQEIEVKGYRDLQRRHLVALAYIATLRQVSAAAGVKTPREPKGLYPEDSSSEKRNEVSR